MRYGVHLKSSILRTYLKAITQGLKDLRNGFGLGHSVDILVTDVDVAREVREKAPGRRVLHSDADGEWEEFFRCAEGFKLNFISRHDESEHLRVFFGWHAEPVIPGELPA